MARKKRSKSARSERSMWRGRRGAPSPMLFGLALLLGAAIAAGGWLLARVPQDSAAASSGLQINEVMSDNASALLTDGGEAPDWIELRNAGSRPVALKGYSLVLGERVNKIFSFPSGELAPGECALVYCEGMEAGAEHGDWSAPFRLPASGGEALVLIAPDDSAADRVDLPELSENEVYARGADGAWEIRPAGTPGRDNAFEPAESEAAAQAQPDRMEISELCADNTLYFPDESGACYDYIELHNAGSEAVNLEGWHLSDDRGKLKRWSFPEVVLPAGGYLAVHCSGLDRISDAQHLHTDFRLGAGEGAFLARPDGQLACAVTPPELLADQAWSLVDGAWSAELAPTPGAENTPESAARVNEARFGSAGVRLNEIMASAEEEPYDWVELYNATSASVDLSGYGLSDSSDRPRRWQFPQGTALGPGEYLGVLLSGKSGASSGGYLNADFKLSAAGGCTVTLAEPSGRVVDAAYLPKQYGGKSYGRADGEAGFFYYDAGTPIAPNAGSHYRDRAAEAAYSQPGGLYSTGQSFSVSLDAPAGSRVFYTLDGSDPDESSTPYTGPIQVAGTTILRSRVYRDGCMPSLIATRSYLFDVRNESSVYVVSLVTDADNINGPDGLVAEGNLMRDIEREAHIEIFLPDGSCVISQGCGLSLHGSSSRRQAIKSFNVIARSEYGSNRFNYPLFSKRDYPAYQSLLLRPSGEDQGMSFMRDSVLSSLMRDSSLMYQEAELCVVYINGEYYTLDYLRERINKFSICQFEGWEDMEDEIDIVKGNDVVIQGSNASFRELLEYVKSADMTAQAAYDYVDERIDIQNYMEYMGIEIFSGNADLLNVRRYRNARANGKWRWALFDLDWGFYSDTNSIERWLHPGGTGSANATDNTLFIALMGNPTFRDRFLTHMGEQLATTFSTENVLPKFLERQELLAPMLDQYQAKWGYETGTKGVREYAQTRPGKLIGYFRDTLKLSDADLEKYFGAAIQKIRASGEGNG